ncbi:MAG: hypothetical protein CVT68_10495 [Actinobacteria bacterium HGW-Actinobacteria-8]|nr:MAG: hypothetical protein CVT68_10495 [Actinobacteria bacterium HGW-Actinobacteria-8]
MPVSLSSPEGGRTPAPFPLAAAAVAFIAAYESGESAFYAWVGGATLVMASVIVLAPGVLTVRGFVTGELLRPGD